ncbi:MAG: hypothetical protein KBG15_10700 [Kofleriaceae bacterium]|nr:hypothetical protein [Kofleriaceae bacterium]
MLIPTENARRAMKPSRRVLFFRTFWPYQMLRFLWLNFRMLRIIFKSHG